MNFNELSNEIQQIREKEESPIIFQKVGDFLFQIYANNPLRFSVLPKNWLETKAEPLFKFCVLCVGSRKKFVVTTVKARKEFCLDESTERLVKEFPNTPCVHEFVDCLSECERRGVF